MFKGHNRTLKSTVSLVNSKFVIIGALRVQFIITRRFKLIIICNKSQNIYTFSRWSALKINRVSKRYIFSIFYFRILHHNTRYAQFKRVVWGRLIRCWGKKANSQIRFQKYDLSK